MSAPDAIGSVGVTLLLVAFVLNVFGVLQREARSYQLLNAVGGTLAGYASYLIGFFPFVILEGTWSVVAIVALLRPASAGRHT